MDGERFDDLTKKLAGGVSRRRALGLLAGGTVSALGAAFGRGRRAAAQDINDACFSDFDCDSGFCNRPQGRRRGKCAESSGCPLCGIISGTPCCPPSSCFMGLVCLPVIPFP